MCLGTMPHYPSRCSICHKHGCIQDHQQWCYMDDGALTQTVLEGLGEVFWRSGHAQVPYPPLLQIARNMHMMDAKRQYVRPSASASTSIPPLSSCFPCPPTFPLEALDFKLFSENNADGLAACIQDAYLAPPLYSTHGQRADNGPSIGPDHVRFLEMPSSSPRAPAAHAPYMQDEPSSSYTASATGVPGYVVEPHVPGPNMDMSYAESSRPPLELRFLSPTPSPIPSISPTERLEQGTYQHKQLFEGKPAGPIHFNVGIGICYGALAALVDGAEPAFSPSASIGMKASIRFELLQLPRQGMRQVRVRHGGGRGRSGRPITLREMGERVFEELKRLIDHAKSRGDPLRHRGFVIDIERVVLLRVDHISKGSIQPILGIRREG